MHVQIKRIYAAPAPDDGLRVLVDRLWPRGVRRADAALDQWAKDLAPSTELRRWFGHDPEKFHEFARRYRAELAERDRATAALLTAAENGVITLLYAARNPDCNHALVLAEHVRAAAAR